ncbi:MAG: UPF0149 family protein [Pseudomonadota bacterium]|nr:UPF0149 family protein [Pseudomonadota bacterium]
MNNHLPAESHPLREVLNIANITLALPEVHGSCCGWVCLGGAKSIKYWATELIGIVDKNDTLALDQEKKLHEFSAENLLKLEKGDLDFNLLLPSDDCSLDERTTALAEWCQGFIDGIALGSKANSNLSKKLFDLGVMREILEDFSEITLAVVGADEEEVTEDAYAEIVEYVRISVQLVYDETKNFRNNFGTTQ